METPMEKLGKSLILTILGVLDLIAYGIVFQLMWEWFAIPAFEVMAINKPTAIGLVLMVTMLTSKIEKKTPTFEETLKRFWKDKWILLNVLLIAYTLTYFK